MDRNTIIGFALIFLLVIGYSVYNQQHVSKQNREKQSEAIGYLITEGALRAKELDNVRTIKDAALAPQETPEMAAPLTDTAKVLEADSTALFPDAVAGTERLITIENELIRITLSSVGGKVSSVEVKGYRTFTEQPLLLFKDGHAGLGIRFMKDRERAFVSDSLHYTVVGESFTIEGTGKKSVSFVLRNDSVSIEHRYTLSGESHFVDFDLIVTDLNKVVYEKERSLRLTWETKLGLLERDYEKAQDESTIYFSNADGSIDYLSETKEYNNYSEGGLRFPLKWVAHKHQFFVSAIVSKDSFPSARSTISTPDSADYVKRISTTVYLPFDRSREQTYAMQFFFGPLQYRELKRDGLGMEKMIPMGSSILGWINRNVIYPVYRAFNSVFGNVAMNILLLAIFIKIVLSPLTFRSYKSQAKMRVLKPEIDELRAKYGKDARKMQMEQMKLYRKVGVNMFGGCIPMLLQFPVLIALYRFFPNVIDLRQEGFLWVYDFSTYDSIADLPFTIPFYGAHISLLTILMAISSFFYSRMNQQMTPGAMGQQMKTLQYIFPFMLVFIFNSFPAGLTYYYLLYNVLTFVQQWFFKKFLIDEAAIRAKMEEHKARPQKEGRFARFQKRLEASQRAQMEARRNPKRR